MNDDYEPTHGPEMTTRHDLELDAECHPSPERRERARMLLLELPAKPAPSGAGEDPQ